MGTRMLLSTLLLGVSSLSSLFILLATTAPAAVSKLSPLKHSYNFLSKVLVQNNCVEVGLTITVRIRERKGSCFGTEPGISFLIREIAL